MEDELDADRSRRRGELRAVGQLNAVAAITYDGRCILVTAGGIDVTCTRSGIHDRAWMFTDHWEPLPPLPGPPGIAASAVALRRAVYVLGGYSVAATGSETTHTEVAVPCDAYQMPVTQT